MRVVVTGGGGYVGYHIGWALSRTGHDVALLDLAAPDPEWEETAPHALHDALPDGWLCPGEPGKLEFVKGDITDEPHLRQVFRGASGVVHTASYGMSGLEQMGTRANLVDRVNVGGTCSIIAAARHAQVRALVYTSTINVVFHGQKIESGDETLPLAPLHAFHDHYSRTKAVAEKMVLIANGTTCSMETSPPSPSSRSCSSNVGGLETPPTTPPPCCPQPVLRTCALRLGGVMGLAERRHTNRILGFMRSGLTGFRIGSPETRVDFVGIQNVVQGHVRALLALLREECSDHSVLPFAPSPLPAPETYTSEPFPRVAGEVFFISDYSPVNQFELFRPMMESLGYGSPKWNIPVWLMLVVAFLQEIIYHLTRSFYPLSPYMSRSEVYTSGVTHYFSCEKAQRILGYRPTRPNDHSQLIRYLQARHHAYTEPPSAMLPLMLGGLVVLLVLLVF